jgi:hypothetical protein
MSGEFVPGTLGSMLIVFPSKPQCNQRNATPGIASQSTFPEAVRVFVSDGCLHPCIYWRTGSFATVTQVEFYSLQATNEMPGRGIKLLSLQMASALRNA